MFLCFWPNSGLRKTTPGTAARWRSRLGGPRCHHGYLAQPSEHSAFLSSAFDFQVPKVAGSPLDLHPRSAVPPLRPRSLEWGGPWWHRCQGSGHRHLETGPCLGLRLATVLSEITFPTLALLVLLPQHPINAKDWSLSWDKDGMNLVVRDTSTLQITFSLCHFPPDKLLFEFWGTCGNRHPKPEQRNQEQAPLGQLWDI